ncbi:MAG: prephenate dehydrogenase/arogenate dehydrogenase family protein [Pseudomonadota bacterium]
MTGELNGLRDRLDDIDRELLQLVAERQRVVADIGATKRASGAMTRDFDREREVVDLARERAAVLGVDPAVAESLMTTLIRTSLTSQEEARVAAEGSGTGQSVLLIGGSGKMGGWFARYFSTQGFRITVADPRAPVFDAAHVEDWHDAGLDFDVVVVATQLGLSAVVLNELADAGPPGLVFDIGSLKSPLRRPLARARDAGLRIASLHPMFGPDTRLLSGRHMIFVDAGHAEATAAAKRLFAATMVERLDMSLDDHDRLIAYVLGLSHALNIAFFTALAESGEAAPKLATLSSTTFDAQLAVASQVAGESPDLYFEIQHLNEFGLHPLAALCDATERVLASVQSGDKEGFTRLMQAGRDYFERRGSA